MICPLFYLYLMLLHFFRINRQSVLIIYTKQNLKKETFLMKKIIALLVILAVFAALISLAACGGKAETDIKDEMSTVKDDGMSMVEDLSSALSDLDEDLTQGGNVTKDDSSTGLFETMPTESTTSDTAEPESSTLPSSETN